MNIEFTYLNFTTFYLGESPRPIARVRMASPTDSVIIDLIIDSGADITLVDLRVAQQLGIDLPTPDELYSIEGVGSGTPVYYREIQMTIGEYTFPCRIGILPYSTFTRILGQADVFDRFAIEFRKFEGKVIFIPRE